MKLLEETDTASRIGEAIGKLFAIFIIGALVVYRSGAAEARAAAQVPAE